MPLPQRGEKETRENFISRCMSDDKASKEFPNRDQRLAVCMTRATEDMNAMAAIDLKYNVEELGYTEDLNEDNFYIPTEAEYVDFGEQEEDWDIAVAKPGLWENIRKKKEREGKNYRPAKPGDPDRPTQEQLKRAQEKKICGTNEESTEALQRGKPGPNDPRKTPAPKKDQKKGSKKNKPGST